MCEALTIGADSVSNKDISSLLGIPSGQVCLGHSDVRIASIVAQLLRVLFNQCLGSVCVLGGDDSDNVDQQLGGQYIM